MAGTLVSFLVIFACAAALGQAIACLAGARRASLLAPALGLAALLPVAWATVRMPGGETTAIIVIAVLALAAAGFAAARLELGLARPRTVTAIALAGLAAALLPFVVEGRFGILGTGLNPDTSQHLFAAERLAGGGVERLISDGYPLGPHALVVAVSALGPNLVHGFDGLMIAVALAGCLAAASLFEKLTAWRQVAGALLVGFAYLLASNYVQGAFKEAIEAVFVLAFAIALGELARAWPNAGEGRRALRAIPLAVLAIGSVYAYSFPGLLWIAGTLAVWAAIELALLARRRGAGSLRGAIAAAWPAFGVAVALLVVAVAPEVGRIIDFANFETFDPNSAGLGNLFNRLSPLEALGVWPSGDFRVEPGDGGIPALGFYLGAAFALAALAFGLRWSLRGGERALPAALAAAAALWLYSLVAGTPYQEAKALVIIAPLVAAISVRGLLAAAPTLLALAFVVAAGGSSLLALANGPVGPTNYSPTLNEVREALPRTSIYVLAPAELLDNQHGYDYLSWELRGNRLCIAADDATLPSAAGEVAIFVTTKLEDGAVTLAGILESPHTGPGSGPCTFVADGARADPGGDD